jgi:lactate dehydrogenase-like 2-hydroxyacid dehydrogenase
LIVTPHAASLTDEVMERVFRTSVQEQELCFEGKKPMFLLNDV